MDPALLYSSPYTDFSPSGVDGVFGAPDAAEIVSIVRSVSKTAAAWIVVEAGKRPSIRRGASRARILFSAKSAGQ